MIASAPVRSSTSFACSGVETSPLAITGMPTRDFTSAIVSYSAAPSNMQARVRPWMASAWAPAACTRRAMRTASRRVRKHGGVGAGDLYGDRMRLAGVIEAQQRLARGAQLRPGGDHLRHGET